MTRFGAQIRHRREQLGLRQIDLSELISDFPVSAATISNAETGRSMPRPPARKAIIDTLTELESSNAEDLPAQLTVTERPNTSVGTVATEEEIRLLSDAEEFTSMAMRLISRDCLRLSSLGFVVNIGGREITLQVRDTSQ